MSNYVAPEVVDPPVVLDLPVVPDPNYYVEWSSASAAVTDELRGRRAS